MKNFSNYCFLNLPNRKIIVKIYKKTSEEVTTTTTSGGVMIIISSELKLDLV